MAVGVITRIVSSYGVEPVAGFGVATRVEFFAMVVVMALASVIVPFVGQNWGARMFDRVRRGIKLSNYFSIGWGFGVFVLLVLLARPIASIFNDNPIVISTVTLYFRIVAISYGLFGIVVLASSTLNALHKPIHSAMLIIVQIKS